MTPRWAAWALGAGLLLAWPAWAGEFKCQRENAGRHVLRFGGGIKEGEFKRFAAAFNDCFPSGYGGQVVFDLFSGGGSVNEALEIANALIGYGARVRPVLTRVSRQSYCISACTYLFVAGQFREVEPGGSFEPHGFSSYSGSRIDEAVLAAIDGQTLDPKKLDLQGQRARFLALTTASLAQADRRLAWLEPLLAEYARTDGRIRNDAEPALAAAYLGLDPAQRALVANLDAIVAVAMPELQREAALKAFAPHLGKRSPGAAAPDLALVLVLANEDRYVNWILGEFQAAINQYLVQAKAGARIAALEMMRADVLELQRRQVRSTMETVTRQLWPYLATRRDALDVDGLVRLMFSTSIIYTRPLTREELCDFNIVNKDCS